VSGVEYESKCIAAQRILQFDGIEPGRDSGRAAIAVSVDIRAAVGHAKGDRRSRQHNSAGATPGKPGSPSPRAILPVEDLKPCTTRRWNAGGVKRSSGAAQGDLADEKMKTQALSRERDDALQVAKGGTAMQRMMRAAKRFAIGAAAGALAAKIAH
jgi:hypothetical protein